MFSCVQCIDVGDIVVGVVTTLLDAGLLLTLIAVENGTARDIDQLKIAVCLSCFFSLIANYNIILLGFVGLMYINTILDNFCLCA